MRKRHAVGFAVFCLMAGSRWLVENAYPNALPSLLQQGLHFAVAGVVALLLWIIRGRSLSKAWPRIVVAGLLLLGVPATLNELAEPVVGHAGAALFTLVPLFVGVGVAALMVESGSRALMLPALVGIAGGLLVLPFELPSTGYGAMLFGVVLGSVLVTAAGSVWLHGVLREVDLMQAVLFVCGGNALLLLGVSGLVLERAPASLLAMGLPGELLRTVVFDLPTIFLLVWLVREMQPGRLATRYLLVPLVTVIEGLVLFRPSVDMRTALGVLLMAAGGGALLVWRGAPGGDVLQGLDLG